MLGGCGIHPRQWTMFVREGKVKETAGSQGIVSDAVRE